MCKEDPSVPNVDPPVANMETLSSPPPQKWIKEPDKDAYNKSKPTLLFGKHEGEIIHKLLAPNIQSQKYPITRDTLITIPVEEFNQLLEQAELTEIEVAFMKEWRRRGKNKAAAQVARKRKREEVSDLDREVQDMRQQKNELEQKYNRLRSLVESLKKRTLAAEDKLFKKHHQSVQSVSRSSHLLHVTDDKKLLFVPRDSSNILVAKN